LALPEASSLPFMSASVAGRKGSFVLPPDFRIGDAAVDHRHGCALMAQDGHDHLDPRSVLGQLGAQSVAQSVCADGPGSLASTSPAAVQTFSKASSKSVAEDNSLPLRIKTYSSSFPVVGS
jgi:hypothetical protein